MTDVPRIHFGVGCFMFAVSDCRKTDEWFDAVSEMLSSIGSVDEISTDNPGKNFHITCSVESEDGDVEHVLQPHGGAVSFTLTIPDRFQEKVWSGWSRVTKRIPTTHFFVRIEFHYFGPVAFVECKDIELPKFAASQAVVVVREYLKSEIAKLDGRVIMHTIGPSPFHVDFTVIIASEEEIDPDDNPVKIIRQSGYDACEITYPDRFDSRSAVMGTWHVLGGELSLYYDLTRRLNLRGDMFAQVHEQFEELVHFHRRTGFRAVGARIFRTSKRARELLVSVMEAEMQEVFDRKSGEAQIDEHGRATATKPIFLNELNALVSSSYINELKAIRESATILESGRTKEFEVFVISISTLLGGVAGALAALLAS